jgi:carboxypeptidase Taq
MDTTLHELDMHLKKMRAMEMALALFSWDMSTIAPRAGAPSRAPYIGAIAQERFELLTGEKTAGFLSWLSSHPSSLDERHRAIERLLRREYESNIKIPSELILEYSELIGVAQTVWEKAKEENSYPMFAPTLSKIVDFQRRFVDLRGWEAHPYNTLLDDFDEGMTTEKLDRFFGSVRSSVAPLLKRALSSTKKISSRLANAHVPIERQRRFSKFLMEQVGFDSQRGLLSESAHPFTMGFGRDDVRIATHYYEDRPLSSIYSVIHECGHAIYEQGADPSLAGTMLEGIANMSLHESQSRFFENIVGRSRPFLESVRDSAAAILGGAFEDATPEELYEAANAAFPSLIRVEADELTYSLHIVARYELEKAMIEGTADIASLPDMWNEKYKECLGLTPDCDANGILQDVHWSAGSFGYFPSYALGNAYASQIFAAMKKELNFAAAAQERGLGAIRAWLKEKIHRFGSLKPPGEIIFGATGEELNADRYTGFLSEKYGELYEV